MQQKLAPASAAVAAEDLLQLEWSFGYLFKQAHRTFTRALDRRLKAYGITLAQWYFLRELWREEDITQRELSRRMDVSEPTTAVALELMEKAALIERKRDPAQRNSVRVRLTTQGRRLKRQLLPIARDVNVRAAEGIDAKTLQTMREAILRMIGNLGSDDTASPAPAATTAARRPRRTTPPR